VACQPVGILSISSAVDSEQAQLDGAPARAIGAHKNAVEALPLFAAAVLVAPAVGADPQQSAGLAIAWVVCRLLHGLAYVADAHSARSMVWTGGLTAPYGLFGLAALAG